MRARALLVSTLTAAVVATGIGVASPAQAAGGSVANSCAVIAKVTVEKKGTGRIERLGCGQGTSNVRRATVTTGPYYVKLPGKAPMCRQAGVWFYPNNTGYERTAVLTPTVRCSTR